MTDRPMDPGAQLKQPPLAYEKPEDGEPPEVESYEEEIEAEESGTTAEGPDQTDADEEDDEVPEVAYQPRSG